MLFPNFLFLIKILLSSFKGIKSVAKDMFYGLNKQNFLFGEQISKCSSNSLRHFIVQYIYSLSFHPRY